MWSKICHVFLNIFLISTIILLAIHITSTILSLQHVNIYVEWMQVEYILFLIVLWIILWMLLLISFELYTKI